MLKRTPFYERHRALGARMVEFGGWEMPVQYSGIMHEHHAVRNGAGLFDISHMGRFVVKGSDAERYLDYLVTADIASLEPGAATYGLLCHPHGGIVDDVFVYRILPDQFMVVVNAANRAKDWEWFQRHTAGFQVSVEDYSERWPMLALQGPAAEALLAPANSMPDTDLTTLPFHHLEVFRIMEHDMFIARTGYTGEDGFEIFPWNPDHATALWDVLLNLGAPGSVVPCGLGARDSLRFEPCLALYGHEIADDINPYEARLGWVVKLDKGDFIGRDALLQIQQAGPARKLAGFEMVGKGIARADYPIHTLEGEPVGHVTTGMHAPTLGKPFGIGLVSTALSKPGTEFDVMIRNRAVRARVVKMPFYKPQYKK